MAKRDIDMTTGNLFKKIIIYSIPIILTSVLQLLYNACDLMVVGKFAYNGTEALAAVGSTGSMISLITSLFIGLSIGASVSYAKSIGKKDYERANKVVHTSVIVSSLASVIITIVGITYGRFFLELMDSPSDVIDLSTIYVQIYFAGTFFNLLYNFLSAILRAHGDTKRPLYILTISGIVNVLLNLFFVLVCKMSVEGVAIATIISQTVSAITLLIILCKETGTLNFSFKKLKFDKDIFVEMIIVGLPSGIQSTFFSISNMTIQSAVNGFGKIVMSGNATAGNLEGFVYVSMNSIQQAALNFAGQNYGAKKYNNIKKTLIYSLIIVFLVGGILGSAFYLLGPWLLRLYTNDPEVIKVALNRMQFVCLLYFLFGMMDVLVGWMRGLGYSFIPMIISLLGVCAFRVFWVEVIFKANPTLTSLYLSYPISWLLTGSVLLIFIIIILSIIKKRFVVLKNENEELVLSETKAC